MQQKIKFTKLINFIKQNLQLANQGSVEWLNIRKNIIGGSELSTILGVNPYNKIENLVADKIGLTKFKGNVATRWGQLFEEISRIILETILLPDNNDDYKIYETGSLEGIIPNHRFSPDGLSVFLYNLNNKEILEYLITLLEFKSPLRSIPNGYIPEYYIPQICAGLCDIELSEIGLFINNMYRKCSLSDLNYSINYDINFHKSDFDIKKNFKPNTPLAYGIIGFYQTKEQVILYNEYNKSNNHKLSNNNELYLEFNILNNHYNELNNYYKELNENSDKEENSDNDNEYNLDNEWNLKNIDDKIKELNSIDKSSKYLIDFGDIDIDKLLKYIELNLISIQYFKPNINIKEYNKYLPNELIHNHNNNNIISYKLLEKDPLRFIEKFSIQCKNNNLIPIGYLPWKLFKSDIIVVEKDPLYIYQFVDKIQDTILIIKDINSSELIDDKIIKFKEYFPKYKIK
jgi:hypothetical protein